MYALRESDVFQNIRRVNRIRCLRPSQSLEDPTGGREGTAGEEGGLRSVAHRQTDDSLHDMSQRLEKYRLSNALYQTVGRFAVPNEVGSFG